MRMRYVPLAIGIILLSVLIVIPISIPPVSAIEYWEDTITLYPSSTSLLTGIREIQNPSTDLALDVKVQYYYSSNIDVFKKYYLTGNGTSFTMIDNGVVTKIEDTKRLSPNQKLLFDIEACPKENVTIGQTASVTVQITRTEVALPPPPPPPPTFIPKKYTLLIQVLDLFSMKAPNLDVFITDQATGKRIAELKTDFEGKTEPIKLRAGTYIADIYYQNKLQYSQTIILKEDTTLTIQIGIPIVITFTHIILILLTIIISIGLIIIIIKKRRG